VSASQAPLALYVHWPFCRVKCPYCDFNVHIRPDVDHDRWRRALCAEIDHFANETEGRTVASIYFGGGTPSLMAPATVAAIVDRVAARWTISPDIEITLEANPDPSDVGRFADYRLAGVARLSLGIQSLDDRALAFLGRAHDRADAIHAITEGHAHFERLSVDFIYARPGQDAADWRRELAQAIQRAGEHISLYQLTIEAGTAFGAAHKRGRLPMPDDAVAGALYETTQEALGDAGFDTYEISNHARPGGQSQHNLAYWRYQDYLGIGPGAHGRLTIGGTKFATRQTRNPRRWLEAVTGSFLPRVKSDEKLRRFFDHRGDDGLEREMQLLIDCLSAAAGGPLYSTGRDMKTTHKGMRIDE
jgi:putative oxygen-independent coproporphyrinogen III oxidase